MNQVIVFCDIDQTINVSASSTNPPRNATHWFGEWCEFTVLKSENPSMFEFHHPRIIDLEVKFAPELLENLGRLSTSTEFRWFTDWAHHSHSIFCRRANFPVGLKWKVEGETHRNNETSGGEWWKMVALREFLTQNPAVHVIWLDDLATDYGNEDALLEMIEEFQRLTVIVPHPNRGITRNEISILEKMIENPVPMVIEFD